MAVFFKKMIGAAQDILGTLTVVSPELITKKGFDANTEYSDTIMKVPAKNFYNYLGHWLTPDVGLKSETYTDPYLPNQEIEGRGLDIGPFSYDAETSTYNDLTRALDGKVYSHPGPVHRETQDGAGSGNLFEKGITAKAFNGTDPNETHYTDSVAGSHSYEWEGKWGDTENAYQTSATFELSINANCDRVPGNIVGALYPTGFQCLAWCGDENDYNMDTSNPNTYYKTPGLYSVTGNPGNDFGKFLHKYFNPYYSMGKRSVSNNGKINETLQITIERQPFSRQINWHFVMYARGGKSTVGLMGLVNSVRPSGIINLLNGVPLVKVGDAVWNLLTAPFQMIEQILDAIIGQNYEAKGSMRLGISKIQMSQLNKESANSHPAILNFGEVNENSYMYTQFEYPGFDRNPCYPFTNTFNYRKPMLTNKVVENQYHWDNPYYDHKLMRKYKYYVPNLFRLTFETRQGVFLEQLAKQHKNNNIGLDLSFQIKQTMHNDMIDPEVVRTAFDHEQNLDDLFFPTNSNKWNVFIENGWGDTGTAMNLTFLQNFIDTATIPATQQAETMPAEYSSVFSDYPGVNVSSIAEINNIIGNHNDIKHILESDVGYELNTWTQACADASQFSTLSSGSPKNLSFKIIEYMLWYLDQDGIAFKTRNNIKSLIDYETYLDQEIKDQRGASGGNNLDDYHIIGTELYERECKE